MIQTAPADPMLRKIVLPSVIRISDAFTGRLSQRRLSGSNSLRPTSKTTFTSHAIRTVMVQLQLELD